MDGGLSPVDKAFSLSLLYLQCPPVYLFCTWTTSVMSGQTKGVHLGHPSDLISPQPFPAISSSPTKQHDTDCEQTM